jgi:membrane protease YdiL (CAAX protease family)
MAAPGWYDDPWAASSVRFWDGQRWTPAAAPRPHRTVSVYDDPPLDRAVAETLAADPAPWGWRPVIVPMIAFIATIVAGVIITTNYRPETYDGRLTLSVIGNTVIELLLVVAVWSAGREIAARNGGWGHAFGWRRPRLQDLGWAASGFGIAFVLRIVIAVIANAFTDGRAAGEAQNLRLSTVNLAIIVILVVVVGICAPLIEELVFRGLLLRTFMRRMGFWPAAILSTVIFALFHVYEVDTLAGAITLALSVASFGLVNCVLVRYTARLAPGIGVHMATNLLAVVVLAATAG